MQAVHHGTMVACQGSGDWAGGQFWKNEGNGLMGLGTLRDVRQKQGEGN